MANSYTQCWIHVVFATKNRIGYLHPPPLRDKVHGYLAATGKGMGVHVRMVGGVEDHVHLLVGLPRTMCIADFVKELKRASSLWVKQLEPDLDTFSWQRGYAAFSVSHSGVPDVARYIRYQPQHHQKHDFKTEYLKLLRLHGIEFDERFVFE